jgi:hypothetical protein
VSQQVIEVRDPDSNRLIGHFDSSYIQANIGHFQLPKRSRRCKHADNKVCEHTRLAYQRRRLNLVPLSNNGKAFREHCLNKEGQSATGPIWALRWSADTPAESTS